MVKSKIPVIEGIRIKIFYLFIIVGVLLCSATPFLHILYPKTAEEKLILQSQFDKGEISIEYYKQQKDILWEKYQFIGFKNIRRFLFAIGLPIALFFCSFSLLFFSRYISDVFVKKGSFVVGFSFQFTSIYFILWIFWPFNSDMYDFGINTYYGVLIISSILLAIGMFIISKSLAYQKFEIRELISLTVFLRRKLFKVLDNHESSITATVEKDKIDDKIYDTLEKIVE